MLHLAEVGGVQSQTHVHVVCYMLPVVHCAENLILGRDTAYMYENEYLRAVSHLVGISHPK